jgi:hypothetical protein
MKTSKCFTAFVTVLALQVTAAQAANLVTNPDFTNDFNGWGNGVCNNGTSVSWDGTDGDPAPGSAHLIGSGPVCAISSCIPNPPPTIDMYATIRLAAGSQATVLIREFSDSGCTQVLNSIDQAFPSTGAVDGAWHQYSRTNYSLPAGTNGIQLIPHVQIGSVDAHFDHILFGPAGSAPVRLQTFDVK